MKTTATQSINLPGSYGSGNRAKRDSLLYYFQFLASKASPSQASYLKLALLPLAVALLGWLPVSIQAADGPQISNVHPDFLGRHLRHVEKGKDFFHTHHVVTGENLNAEGVEFWVWTPEGDRDQAIQGADFDKLTLPATPPEKAKRVQPIDVQEQVAVINLERNILVWVRAGDAISKPFLFNVAKPFWVSRESAEPGEVLLVFGRGLRSYQSWDPEAKVVLRGDAGVFETMAFTQARSPRHPDSNMLSFQIPKEVPLGSYGVWCHNGIGGEFGWRSAGEITVVEATAEKPVFDAREFGLVGDGLQNDFEALNAALAKAAEAGGGVVHLPPGTFRIEQTLMIPQGVELVGSGPDQSIIMGSGFDPENAMTAWWTPTPVAASVVILDSHSRLEKVGVRGAVSHGAGGYGMIAGADSSGGWPSHITIKNCRIDAPAEDVETGHQFYRASIVMAVSEYVSILDNDITGSIEMRPRAHRADIINNTIRQGTGVDICSISLKGSHNLVDSNRFVDTPGRLVFYSSLRSYARYNEMHFMGRGGWTNVPEPFLLHGGAGKSMGNPTAATENSLTDSRQAWQENQYARNTVLISHGTGMGQYRAVISNTSDTLVVDEPWMIEPDETSEYSVGGYITDNTLFNNQNFSPGVLSLWLDNIGTLVEKHRDQNGSGITLWGQDRSSVSDDGTGNQLQRFHPSWFNMVTDNWLDGSSFEVTPGVSADNAWRGIPLFGNITTHNKIRHPHTSRSPNTAHSTNVGGLQVNGGKGRVGASHTLLSGNLVSNTPVGAVIKGQARKTFLIGNVFHDVAVPVVDTAQTTVLRANEVETIGPEGLAMEKLPDSTGETGPDWDGPKGLSEPFVTATGQGAMERTLLEGKLSRRAFAANGLNDPAALEQCATNLKELFGLLKKYDSEKGNLPDAGLYPLPGQAADKNLAVLLGPEAGAFLVKESTGPMESIHYIWNDRLSGKKLSDVADPGKVWVMMDMAMAHPWMLETGRVGHQQKVNVLFADGTVRPVSAKEATALLEN